jgi:hypothetical protein
MNAAGSQEVCSGTHSLILLHHVPSIPYENILFLKLHVLSILLLQIMCMSNLSSYILKHTHYLNPSHTFGV